MFHRFKLIVWLHFAYNFAATKTTVMSFQ